MKHVKRKYFKEYLGDIKEKLQDTDSLGNQNLGKELPPIFENFNKKDVIAPLFYNGGVVIGSPIIIKGNNIIIPEPNPTILYFDMAYMALIDINKENEHFLNHFKFENLGNVDLNHGKHWLYNHLSKIVNFVVMLAMSLEAFVNSKLKSDSTYLNRKKEEININEIQRLINFEEKVQKILNKQININFSENNSKDWQSILDLFKCRDSLVHTKLLHESNGTYREVIRESLSIEFEKAIEAVKKFINFYEPNLIEDCDCENDY